MKLKEFKCTDTTITYHGIEGYERWLDGLIPSKTTNFEELLEQHKDDELKDGLEAVYDNVSAIQLNAICDLDNGILATQKVLKKLSEESLQNNTIKTNDGKTILDASKMITIFEDYSNVLQNGFMGTFTIVSKKEST